MAGRTLNIAEALVRSVAHVDLSDKEQLRPSRSPSPSGGAKAGRTQNTAEALFRSVAHMELSDSEPPAQLRPSRSPSPSVGTEAGRTRNTAQALLCSVAHMELSDSEPPRPSRSPSPSVGVEQYGAESSTHINVPGHTQKKVDLLHNPSSHKKSTHINVPGHTQKKVDLLHNPSSHKELREHLEKGKVDPNAKNSQNNAPIHSLVMRKASGKKQKLARMHLLVTLLTFGDVDIEQVNGEGDRALHLAVKSGDPRSIKVLIAFGANVNALNAAKQTPLDLLKGPRRVFSDSLRGSQFFDLLPERVTSPVKKQPLSQQLHGTVECTDSSDTSQEDVPTAPVEKKNGAVRDNLRFPRRPTQRLLNFTSPLEFSEIPESPSQASSHSSFCRMLETGTGVDRLSHSEVNDLTEVLQCAGAERRLQLMHSAFSWNPLLRQMIIAVDEPPENLPESEHTTEQAVKKERVMNIQLQYFSTLNEMITKRLSTIDDPFSNTVEKELSLAVYMREMRMMQMAGSRILFLDGGGMRGLIHIEILSQIERQTGRKVTELFDWIVGTSIGGVMALALVHAKMSVAELRDFLFRAREDVFKDPKGGLSFDTDTLESMLKERFGEMKMCDVKYPRVLVAATYKEKVNLKLHFFNNCFEDKYSDHLVWKVARYTSAGPIFFTEKDNYVDGGILAQNPSGAGLTAIQKHYRDKGMKLPISLLVSIGSGQYPSQDLGNVDATEILYFGSHWWNIVSSLGSRISSLTSLLSNALTESETVSENCRFRCEEQGIKYFRFNPELDKVVSAGEGDLPTLMDMVLAARRLTNSSEFRKLLLCFVTISNRCSAKKNVACYSEKMQKLKTELKV